MGIRQSNNALIQGINPQMGFIGQLPPLNMSQTKKIIARCLIVFVELIKEI